METNRITARGLFDLLEAKLESRLREYGFFIIGKLDLQRRNSTSKLKRQVIIVDLPRISDQLVNISPLKGTILPAFVSVIETYPGEVAMSIVNPMERYFTAEDARQLNLTKEITSRLQTVIQSFSYDPNVTPDLVTSWQ